MMKHILTITLLTTCTCVYSQGIFDGFLKGKGTNDLAFSTAYQTSETYFAGTKPINYKRDLLIFNLFSEYGVTERFDVIASIPLINFELQDASIGLKYAVMDKTYKKGQFTLMPAVGVSFPLSNYNTETAQSIGQRATIIQMRGIIQYKSNKSWFVQVQSGYNYAFSPVPSSFPLSAKIGYIFKKNYIDVWFDHQTGLGKKDFLGALPYDSFREFTVSYNRVGGVYYRQFTDKFGAMINLSYIIDGRNIGQAITPGIGVVWKMKPK